MKADGVFEGGGVRGIGLVGALAGAEEKGYEFVYLAGTSAGAIVAALKAAGYTALEMKKILMETDFTTFLDPTLLARLPGFVGMGLSIFFHLGIYRGQAFEDWLRNLLARKGLQHFGDLVMPEYARRPAFRYRLRVVAADLSRGRMLALPQDIAYYGLDPDYLEVARAVRMSMSIPFFFCPVVIQGCSLKMKKKKKFYLVDGGILSNFPVWIFDRREEEQKWPTFGFKLRSSHWQWEECNPIRGPFTMARAIVETMMEAHDARYLEEASYARTIVIPTGDVKAVDFSLSRKQKEKLYQKGREAAEKFFATWDYEGYCRKYVR